MPAMRPEGRSRRLPQWFKIPLSTNGRYLSVRRLMQEQDLHTVCKSAACPNRNECWNLGTATFLILGDRCTRGCRFCNVVQGPPGPIDHDEPDRVAKAVRALELSHAVVTSVTRDDLPDGGAEAFAATIRAIRSAVPGCTVEVLVPDFQGSETALLTVLKAAPDVLNHNMETVPSRYQEVRPQADFDRSLRLLDSAKRAGMYTKSGLMVGLGEGMEEVLTVLRLLRNVHCDALTVGQYLRPSVSHLPVARYYSPQEFSRLRDDACRLGFRTVLAGPLVRSSYHAAGSVTR